jgi:hypothetical protein
MTARQHICTANTAQLLALRSAQFAHAIMIQQAKKAQESSFARGAAIRQAHDAGCSWAEIATHLGVTRSAVSRFAKEVTTS